MTTKHLKWAALLGALFAAAVHADDTEIYLGANLGASEAKPNVVFILDTSGSMDSNIVVTSVPYDPLTTYTGSCVSNRIYWSTGGTAPDCTTSHWFDTTANKCDKSLTPLATTGIYFDNIAMWRSDRSRWIGLNKRYNTYPVECKGDAGIHGDGVDATKLYPADGTSGPWQNGLAGSIAFSSSATLYSGNYLNYRATTPSFLQTRLQIVQDVFRNIINSTQNINVAIMRFDATTADAVGNPDPALNRGGYFLTPMQNLDATTRSGFITAVDGLISGGFTPLAETLYEAAAFYRGDAVKFGFTTTPGTSDPATNNGTNYITPIQYQCQKNFVVLLTDGDPTYDTDADADIKALPQFSTLTGSSTCTGDCLDELAQYLYKGDHSTLPDTQNVITYTVGFATTQQLLQDAANKGGGKYFTAFDTDGLTDAFTTILTEILAVNTTFTAPVVSVNAFNRLTHLNELYFALFRPNSHPHWDGNIKKYKIVPTATGLDILDENGVLAVDPNTGFFKTTSQSYWHRDPSAPAADLIDGDNVSLGGAANMLPLPAAGSTPTATERKVYTYLDSVKALTAPSNLVHETTPQISDVRLGMPGAPAALRDNVLKWARGVDVLDDNMNGLTTDTRTQMGDPLHTEPLLVTYGTSGGTMDMTLYATTNEGFLHAVDANTGVEDFAFIPEVLLPNLKILMEDMAGNPHPYGLDGPLSLWIQDANGNGQIETGDKVYLYSTMRRGGRNIYALDVSDRTSPSILWTINGGGGGGGSFAQLGQTWSKLVHARVMWGGVQRDVVIFGGGYDTNQDASNTGDTVGKAIFMVDATTGSLIWSAGPVGSGSTLELADMNYSIPSQVTVMDVNGNGFADRMYVGDMGGQLWRFDMLESTALSQQVYGGVIAKLSKNATPADTRRFYYPPSVSMSPVGEYLNIAIGSGYRAHPTDTNTHDKFFVVRDPNVDNPATDAGGAPVYPLLVSGPDLDLYNATPGDIISTDPLVAQAAKLALAAKQGWFLDLNDGGWIGEKNLADSLTSSGIVFFSTFSPIAAASASACAPNQGSGKAYAVCVETGSACVDMNGDGVIDNGDKYYGLVRSGIPPRPVEINAGSTSGGAGKSGLCIGTECADPGQGARRLAPYRLQWRIMSDF